MDYNNEEGDNRRCRMRRDGMLHAGDSGEGLRIPLGSLALAACSVTAAGHTQPSEMRCQLARRRLHSARPDAGTLAANKDCNSGSVSARLLHVY